MSTHRIVALEGGDARRHDVAREEFGERRRNRREQIGTLDQIDVRVAGAAHAGQHGVEARDLLARESDAFGQPQPEFETAFAGRAAVVVVQALHPFAPERGIGRLGENRAVLQRDARLVVIPVAHPGLDLVAREPALRACAG